MIDLQKAPFGKRIFAFLADLIVAGILISGIYFALSAILDIDGYTAKYDEIKSAYEEEYGVSFDTTQEQYDAMTEAEKDHYREAVDAMNADEDANKAIKTSFKLIFITFASGIVVSMLILEFIVPLLLKDGRTLGKRLFGLGVMRTNYVRITPVQLFVRGVIGKGVFELVLPILIVMSVLSGRTGMFGLILLGAMVIAEIVVLVKSDSNSMLHDVLADTAVVDWASQMIFENEKQRDEYVRRQKEEIEQNKLY